MITFRKYKKQPTTKSNTRTDSYRYSMFSRSHSGSINTTTCIAVLLVQLLLFFTFITSNTTLVDAVSSSSNNVQQDLQNELYDIINIAKGKIVENGSKSSSSSSESSESKLVKDKVVQLTTNITKVIQHYKTIFTLYTDQNKLIDEINIYQLQRLINKLQLLSTTYPIIHTNLTTPPITTPITTIDSTTTTTTITNKTARPNSNYITLNKLKDILTPNSILNKVEDYVHTHLQQLISKDVTTSKTIYDTVTSSWKNITSSNKKIISKKKTTNKKQSISDSNNDCFISGYDAAKTLHEQLINYNNDYIGLNDIIQQYGATIVHEMTSVTYQGSGTTGTSSSPTSDNDNNNNDVTSTSTTIGNSWYRKYIPYDWELYLLPIGWEYYNDPTISITNLYKHWLRAFGFATSTGSSTLSSSTSSTTGTSTTLNAIPETIFNPNTIMPGSCWPMATTTTNKNGYITIRLSIPQNNTITKISIDHISKLNIIQPNNTLQSAIKYFNVYTYKSCTSTTGSTTDSSNDNNNKKYCNGLGFDITSKQLMNSKPFKYDINHIPGKIGSVQTFPLRAVNASKTITSTSTNGDDSSGTCSPSKPACTGANLEENSSGNINSNSNDDTAAIGIEILENWGKKEYTCIYRIRLHTE